MFWIVLLLVTGGTYTAVNRGLDSPAGMALLALIPIGLILWVPIQGILWFNETTGVTAFLEESWLSISGNESMLDIMKECPEYPSAEEFDMGKGLLTIILLLVSLVLLLVSGVFAAISAVGLPAGIIMTAGSALWVLFTKPSLREANPLTASLMVLMAAAASIVITGLLHRAIGYITGTMVC